MSAVHGGRHLLRHGNRRRGLAVFPRLHGAMTRLEDGDQQSIRPYQAVKIGISRVVKPVVGKLANIGFECPASRSVVA